MDRQGTPGFNAANNEGGMVTISKTDGDPSGRAWEPLRGAATYDTDLPPAVSRATRSLLTALGHEDRPLVRTHLETAVSAMAEWAGDEIEKRVAWSRSVREHYHHFASRVGGSPGEAFDATGRAAAGELDKVLRALTDLRDGPVRELAADRVAVRGHEALAAEIREMEAFRTMLIGGWPWSHLPLPAADPAMRAEARAEIARGEGIPVEDLIRQLQAGR